MWNLDTHQFKNFWIEHFELEYFFLLDFWLMCVFLNLLPVIAPET